MDEEAGGHTICSPNKFQARDDVLEKDVEELKKDTPDKGRFKLFQREDGNIDFVIKAGGEKMAWTIDIEDTEDIFNLFGKSGKFPVIVATTVNEEKLLDAGDLELVQKDGYHEYRLDGDKFQTRMHGELFHWMSRRHGWLGLERSKRC